ncbi:OmpP1/FadL family transporter [Thioclava pacifica]|uniref:Aromatic hydrocarbon degradation protein n=1 Tax=Thioclava pacifica DSM 10166 TaxID=1353537 RepID=A0A074J686_9RHOB|nr:outer membrane protein transport protein [Thioclava pacifica]KEO52024.1 hypothetical protein TP2_11145 [Thioclava pacifica DSM 10166]
MKRVMTSAAVLALSAGIAQAGGVERSTQSVGILFEKGNYLELNFGAFNPKVSGSVNYGPYGSPSSGDMAPGYGTFSFGYKQALGDKWDLAIIVDQPVGAKVNYPAQDAPPAGYPAGGSKASIYSTAVTGLVRYKLPNNFSVYGGIRSESVKGNVELSNGYTMTAAPDTAFGYVIGAAWEKPEIAARVALTYNSKIKHSFRVTEMDNPSLPFSTTVPESVNLEFQTGIAKDTLLMGSVRWVHWTQFDITPYLYNLGTRTEENPDGEALVDYSDNTITYNIGVGRRFSDQWSGAIMFGYEKHTGKPTGNLGPTDGYKSVSLAASYQATDNIKVTGGIRYVDIGDATTNPPVNGSFSGNSGWGAGVRVGISF